MLKKVCDLCETDELIEHLATTVPYKHGNREGEICISTKVAFYPHSGSTGAPKPDLCYKCTVYLLSELTEAVLENEST